jgi:predicted DNA-binding ribbon-helix-helix protein
LASQANSKLVPVAREKLISVINQHRGKNVSLASALRVFVAQHYRDAAS